MKLLPVIIAGERKRGEIRERGYNSFHSVLFPAVRIF